MKAVLEFNSELEAWNWVHENFKGKQWFHDDIASESAGYEVYRDCDEYYNYICCLGDRLELNIKEDNKTYNLWIKDESKDTKPACTDEDTLYVGFTKAQILLIKGALCSLSNNLNTSSIMSGKYNEVGTSIECLKLVKKLNEVTRE